MRYASIALLALILSGCSQGSAGTTIPPSYAAFSPMVLVAGGQPNITSVSKIVAKQKQKIVISGSGFGSQKPYDGDSPYIQIFDTTAGFSAGHMSSYEIDSVHLKVTDWQPNKITIAGFTGDYGQNYWYLSKGDDITVNVWSAKTGNGPASKKTTVK
jgi:hypothetical protein